MLFKDYKTQQGRAGLCLTFLSHFTLHPKIKREMEDTFIWLFSFFIYLAIIVLLAYQLMCLSDLEFDHTNPYDAASRVNKVVLPEFITQGATCIIHLVTGHWFMSLLGLPYLFYNARLYLRREHKLDVTEIFRALEQEKNKRIFKVGYIIALLCLSIFWLLLSAMEDHEY